MSLLFHTSTRHAARDFPNMGQSKGQAASLEKQLQRMRQARQPRPPKAPHTQKGLPRLERMDTSDSLTEMDTRNSFTTTTKPLSGHPASSKSRSKSRKSVAAPSPPPPHKLASSAKGGVKPVDVPPPPPQKQVDAHAVKSLLDDLATTLRSVADGRTECFGFEKFTPPRRHEVDDDFDAHMRDLHVNPSKKKIRSWETQLRLWRGPVHKDSSSTTMDLSASTNIAVPRDALLSAVHAMEKQLKKVLQSEQQHVIETAGYWLVTLKKVARFPKGKRQTEVYFVLDNPARPTTLESSTTARVDREAVRVLQALVRRCGGTVKQPPQAWKMGLRGLRMQPRAQGVQAKVWAQSKARISAKHSLAKGRARDAKAASS